MTPTKCMRAVNAILHQAKVTAKPLINVAFQDLVPSTAFDSAERKAIASPTILPVAVFVPISTTKHRQQVIVGQVCI